MPLPLWAKNFPWEIINNLSRSLGLDPILVGAIIQRESAGNIWAWRFEPTWGAEVGFVTPETFAKKNKISIPTEKSGQAHSWGLMQVMGAVARECGFQGHFFQLLDPLEGIQWGCFKLKNLSKTYSGDDLISAYNRGTPARSNGKFKNQEYVDFVKARWNELVFQSSPSQ